jgi:4-hydroxybenzoate polyprenyltransferase
MNDYLSIARPDHWTKNVFVLPGAALAVALYPGLVAERAITDHLLSVLIALASTCLIASANYTINEWLDAKFDRFHPTKSSRAAVLGKLDARFVHLQYVVLAIVGLMIASTITLYFLLASAALLAMGIIYNVEPIRSKDKVYVDVLSESINNALRLVLGWYAIVDTAVPPASVVVSYWMGGAYLMAIKRYAELRLFDNRELAASYRRSFAHYDERRLLTSAVFYALNSAFFLGIFLIKYRVEFLLSLPFLALLFSWYLDLSMRARSLAINPERLYREKKFSIYVVCLTVLMVALLFIDAPFLDYFVFHNDTIPQR